VPSGRRTAALYRAGLSIPATRPLVGLGDRYATSDRSEPAEVAAPEVTAAKVATNVRVGEVGISRVDIGRVGRGVGRIGSGAGVGE
jgi:hypothetical protein